MTVPSGGVEGAEALPQLVLGERGSVGERSAAVSWGSSVPAYPPIPTWPLTWRFPLAGRGGHGPTPPRLNARGDAMWWYGSGQR
jgi:hypothetical protein